MKNREELLRELIQLDSNVHAIVKELSKYEWWDNDEPLIMVSKEDFVNILSKYINKEVPSNDLVVWANAIEITIKDNSSADFVITDNVDAQQNALQKGYDYFLDEACEYNTLPTKDSVIHTTTPGKLEKDGDAWRVIRKASIEFRS